MSETVANFLEAARLAAERGSTGALDYAHEAFKASDAHNAGASRALALLRRAAERHDGSPSAELRFAHAATCLVDDLRVFLSGAPE